MQYTVFSGQQQVPSRAHTCWRSHSSNTNLNRT